MSEPSWVTGLRDGFARHLDDMRLSDLFNFNGMSNSDVFVAPSWVPEIEREKLSRVELHVFPVDRSVSPASRGCVLRKATMGVHLVMPLSQGEESEMAGSAQSFGDALELLLSKKIWQYSITEVNQVQIVDPAEWRTHRVLSTVFLVSFEAIVS